MAASAVIMPFVMTALTVYSGAKAVQSLMDGDYMAALAYGVGAYAGFTNIGAFSGEAVSSTIASGVGESVAVESLASTLPQVSSVSAPVAGAVSEVLGTSPSLLGQGAAPSMLSSSLPSLAPAASKVAALPSVAAGAAQAAAPTSNIFETVLSKGKDLIDAGGNLVKDSLGNFYDKDTMQMVKQGSGILGAATDLVKPFVVAGLQERSNDKNADRQDKLLADKRAEEEARRIRINSSAY